MKVHKKKKKPSKKASTAWKMRNLASVNRGLT